MPAATHGKSNTAEYRIWKAMKTRCLNPNCEQWAAYGGRGITICSAWQVDFAAFLNAVGRRPNRKYILDREDNDRGYEPGNVRWVTRRASNLNRRGRRIVAVVTLSEAAEIAGLKRKTISRRLDRGWLEIIALVHPLISGNPRRTPGRP